jgi:hypothetical protein
VARLGYWVGGGLAAAVCSGAVAWVVLAFLSLMNQVNGFQRMTAPNARRTIAVGGDVLWDVVPHLADVAAVFLADAGAGCGLTIVTAARRSRRPFTGDASCGRARTARTGDRCGAWRRHVLIGGEW